MWFFLMLYESTEIKVKNQWSFHHLEITADNNLHIHGDIFSYVSHTHTLEYNISENLKNQPLIAWTRDHFFLFLYIFLCFPQLFKCPYMVTSHSKRKPETKMPDQRRSHSDVGRGQVVGLAGAAGTRGLRAGKGAPQAGKGVCVGMGKRL